VRRRGRRRKESEGGRRGERKGRGRRTFKEALERTPVVPMYQGDPGPLPNMRYSYDTKLSTEKGEKKGEVEEKGSS